MVNARIIINKGDLRELNELPDDWEDGVIKGMKKAVIFAEKSAKQRFGTPDNLKVRSGHLRRSITHGVKIMGNVLKGWIGTNVIYAAIHEYGGTIYAKTGKYLRFPINGKWVSKKSVIIPERSFLRAAVEDKQSEIKKIISKSIMKKVDK